MQEKKKGKEGAGRRRREKCQLGTWKSLAPIAPTPRGTDSPHTRLCQTCDATRDEMRAEGHFGLGTSACFARAVVAAAATAAIARARA